MKLLDTVRRAGRNLRQAKGRTLLTALAISVGAFTITAALAAGAGGRQYINSIVDSTGDTSSLMVFAKMEARGPGAGDSAPKEITEEAESESSKASSSGLLTQSDVERVRQVDGISSVSPMFSVSAEYISGQNGKKFAAPLEVKVDKTELELSAGSLPDSQISDGKVTIPESYVESLGFKDANEAIGKTITLRIQGAKPTRDGTLESKDESFTIQAVDKAGTSSMQYQEAIRVSPRDGEAIYRYQSPESAAESYYGLSAQIAPGKDMKAVQEAVKAKGYDVYSLQDMREQMFIAVNVATIGLAAFGGLAILASIFGVINTMYISVLERTQQIGLMKALGMRQRDVSRLFRFEAAWIGFLGGTIGAGLAIILGVIANPFINNALKLEGSSLLVFEPLPIILVIVGLILVAVVSGIMPARKAAKLDPIEALRTE